MVEFTAVAILFVTVTLVCFGLTIFLKNRVAKILMGLISTFMVVGDFFIASRIANEIVPAETNFINMLSTFYFISLRSLIICSEISLEQ